MSQIVTHNGTVYLAGQVGDDMNAGIEQQTREALANIERLLDLAGPTKPSAVGDDLPERH
jgi:enamine deaminase RidA (YjgF/YER057c/UK114 family)